MRVCSQGDGTFEMNAGEVVSYLTLTSASCTRDTRKYSIRKKRKKEKKYGEQ